MQNDKFFVTGTVLTKWSSVLDDLEYVAKTLRKGNPNEVLLTLTKLSKSITSLQLCILSMVAEVGSFIPGPIGIVCSLSLAIGCFAVGDIPGGFFNLLGAIPGGKVAKYLPINMLKQSVSQFKTVLIGKWGLSFSELTGRSLNPAENFRLSKMFDCYFEKIIKSSKDKLSRVGEKVKDVQKHLLTELDDGWNAAREELSAEKAFEYMLDQSR